MANFPNVTSWTSIITASVLVLGVIIYLAFNTYVFGINLYAPWNWGESNALKPSPYNLRYSVESVQADVKAINGQEPGVSSGFSKIDTPVTSSGGFPIYKSRIKNGTNTVFIELSSIEYFETDGRFSQKTTPEYAQEKGWSGEKKQSTLDDASATFSIIVQPGDGIDSQETIAEVSLEEQLDDKDSASFPVQLELEFETRDDLE